MSKPSEARNRLFKYGKPNVRPLEVYTDDGFGKDMAVLWAAYRKGSFPDMKEVTQEVFTVEVMKYLSQFYSAWVIEDKNHQFPSDYGPIGLMVADFNGWEMDPHFMPFTWASPKNRLKAIVGFLQMARYEKGVGVLNISAIPKDKEFYDHLNKRYRVIYPVGKIPRGEFGHDKFLYYGRGGDYFKVKS